MLSVLIPTYNYSAFDLATEIHKQCEKAKIQYEIIVSDDSSTQENSLNQNRKINQLPNSKFEENEFNLGRAKNRNSLSKKAKYEWFLFLDCDTFPKNENFIANYILEIKKRGSYIFYGGICYKNDFPNKKEILRWKYGKAREEIPVSKRHKNSYESTLTSNIVINKDVFDEISFNETITEYGYEDMVFVSELKKRNLKIEHIDNTAYHLNYETSELFLLKTEESLKNLNWIYKNELIGKYQSKIIQKWLFINRWKMNNIFSFLFSNLKSIMRKNLLSNNPSLLIFDLYKLGYFCKINTK